MSCVFVTGATGFIGKRLTHLLLQEGHTVYALCRDQKIKLEAHPNLHIVYGDLENLQTLDKMPKTIEVAYYLVHSMTKKIKDLKEKEKQIAENFALLMKQAQCKQIIYLGGILAPHTKLSTHLQARKIVEDVLKNTSAHLTVFRSSIILGSGGASFEIIKNLVEKLPVMIAPCWVKNLCQPIAIKDVLFYLKSALLNPAVYGEILDIGGPNICSFKELLLSYARFKRVKRYILVVPFLTPKISSYWLVFMSSVKYALCSYLVESLTSNSVCLNKQIDLKIPHQCLSLEKALDMSS